MKNILFSLILIGLALTAKSQSLKYNPFKVDFQVGNTFLQSHTGDGASFTIAPHYLLSDNFAAGLRYEGMVSLYVIGNGYHSGTAFWLNSYAATGEYYLSKSYLRPFIGAGAGFFNRKTIDYYTSQTSMTTLPSVSTIGLFPEAGLEFRRMRLSADYNIIGSNANYLAIKIGVYIGGGAK